jgi:NAD(P)-dependent dehydrogenase (short-subunit alcohol dehydrogenase family)
MAEAPVVIVTGASRGMGREIVRWLATAGAAVVPSARTAPALEEVSGWVKRHGGRALPIALDVSDAGECAKAVQKTIAAFGRIDSLVNNAGVLEPVASMADADPEQWRQNIAVNLLGPFYLTRAALPTLRRSHGRVINISTGAAVKAIEGWTAYCASKAGAAHMTRVLAAEEPDVTAVSFRPGVVDTDMQATIRKECVKGMTTEWIAYFKELKSEGKLLPPAVPAREAAWLALHAPAAWSGQWIETGDARIKAAAETAFPENLP